jgi:putative hemolysin
MLAIESSEPPRRTRSSSLEVRVVRDRALVRQAQRLRYEVLADETGAPPSDASRWQVDEDRFDIHCEHLIVRDPCRDLVVATLRILAPDAARRARGYDAEEQFDISLLGVLRERMVEAGRLSVRPGYARGGVAALMWSGLARYLVDNRLDYALACVSVGLADGGHTARSVYRSIAERDMSPYDCRVFPRHEMPLERLRNTIAVRPPRALRAYLDAGAWVCGEPAWNRGFDRADIPVLLPLARMHGRYARSFLAKAA